MTSLRAPGLVCREKVDSMLVKQQVQINTMSFINAIYIHTVPLTVSISWDI